MDASITGAKADAIRQEFARRGVSISAWARTHGYSKQLVYQVLAGRKRCVRGQCHEIAVRLGLKTGVIGTVADIDALSAAGITSRPSADEEDDVP
ncbi:DNA-binding protein [Stenotrophomonas terrae]|uniref:DNA-binding protein n=1 Tax=Stenotrophomonas terrae TaxID=405446 RepID=UPI0009F87F1F|nr:DNA-binding protein [Stenotrophomonas terrae]